MVVMAVMVVAVAVAVVVVMVMVAMVVVVVVEECVGPLLGTRDASLLRGQDTLFPPFFFLFVIRLYPALRSYGGSRGFRKGPVMDI